MCSCSSKGSMAQRSTADRQLSRTIRRQLVIGKASTVPALLAEPSCELSWIGLALPDHQTTPTHLPYMLSAWLRLRGISGSAPACVVRNGTFCLISSPGWSVTTGGNQPPVCSTTCCAASAGGTDTAAGAATAAALVAVRGRLMAAVGCWRERCSCMVVALQGNRERTAVGPSAAASGCALHGLGMTNWSSERGITHIIDTPSRFLALCV